MSLFGIHIPLPWQQCVAAECTAPASFEDIMIPDERTDLELPYCCRDDTTLDADASPYWCKDIATFPSVHDEHHAMLDKYVAEVTFMDACWRPSSGERKRDDPPHWRIDADQDLDEDGSSYDPANPEFTQQVSEEVAKALHEQHLRQQAETLHRAVTMRGASAHERERMKRYMEVFEDIFLEWKQLQPECSTQPLDFMRFHISDMMREDDGEVDDDVASEGCNRPLVSTWTLQAHQEHLGTWSPGSEKQNPGRLIPDDGVGRTLRLAIPEPTKQMEPKLRSRAYSDHSVQSAETSAQSFPDLDGQSSQSISDVSERHSELSLSPSKEEPSGVPFSSSVPFIARLSGLPLELHVKTAAGHCRPASECSVQPSETSPTEREHPTAWL